MSSIERSRLELLPEHSDENDEDDDDEEEGEVGGERDEDEGTCITSIVTNRLGSYLSPHR